MIESFFHLLRHCRAHWRLYLVGTLALLVVDSLDTFTPKLAQWAIGHLRQVREGTVPTNPVLAATPDSWHDSTSLAGGIWMYGVLHLSIVALIGFFRYLMSMSYARASVRLTYRLRGRFFGHLQRLDASWHDSTKTGDHMSLATNDVEACRMFYGIGLLLLLDTFFYFVTVPLYMATISVKLMLASALPLPLIPFIVARLTHTVENRFEAVQEQFGTVSERARESFAGARVVKSFAREESQVRSFARQAREYMRRSLRFAKIASFENPLLPLMLGLADLVVVVYGGALVIRGEIQVEAFFAFFQYLIRLSGPMIGLGWTIMLFQRARVSMGRIEAAMAVEPSIRDPEQPARVEAIRGAVEFRDVTFSYRPGGAPVLRGVSFSVRPGGTLGIVGPVGSGKTTILNLVPRLYDPPPGTVFVDGHDVRDLPLARLRAAVGAVPQEAFLFGESIRANVLAGVPAGEAGDDRVREALRAAKIDSDVQALPNRYETILGERGVNLSGGQKQRVAIARALARRPMILLLDDCLSAVDTETEDLILEGMREAGRGRTALIVSHRVSAVREADEIIVLSRGRVAERGTHEELVALGGVYADLERKQSSDEEATDGGGR